MSLIFLAYNWNLAPSYRYVGPPSFSSFALRLQSICLDRDKLDRQPTKILFPLMEPSYA